MKFLLVFVFLCVNISHEGNASILPPNDLHLQDDPKITSRVSKGDFDDIIDKAEEFYAPIIESHGGEFVMRRYWRSSTVNATAERDGDRWIVNMYGGMARRPEMTEDAFMIIVCHEIGHHLAGMPQYDEWAAIEGQADFFATHACAKNMWRDERNKNAEFSESVPAIAKDKCDSYYPSQSDRDICYRTAVAGEALASLLASLSGKELPSFLTPDTSEVSRTFRNHPQPQCRLDTYLAGALCTTEFDDYYIPGREGTRRDSELDQLKYSCSQTNPEHIFSARPKCWYKQRYNNLFFLTNRYLFQLFIKLTSAL